MRDEHASSTAGPCLGQTNLHEHNQSVMFSFTYVHVFSNKK